MLKLFNYLNYAFFLCSLGIFAIGYLICDYNVILAGVIVMFLSNVIYGALKWRTHLIFLFFQFTFFTFLLARPLIGAFRGEEWWEFGYDATTFALNSLMITLICLRFGAAIYFYLRKPRVQVKPIPEKLNKAGFQYSLQFVSLILFFLTFAVFMMIECEKLIFMQGRRYEEYYIDFVSSFPSYVFTLASMMRYALCIFLATMPTKSKAFLPLAMYVISAVPSLIIGLRNPIVLNLIFAILYYILRDIYDKSNRWFGRFERLAIILIAPIALLFLSAYNYIRAGESSSLSFFDAVVDLFYKQGVSFKVLCIGYNAIPDLPDVIDKNYTFGEIIDYFTHGTIAQVLFGAIGLGTQNSELLAVYGNSFAHSMSYVAHPNYLNGEGWGSSYILETYADWGYLGVILFSLVMGIVMIWMVSVFKHRPFARVIVLICLLELFFVPRSSATGWFSFIFTFQLWLCIGFCYLCAKIISEHDYSKVNQYSRLKTYKNLIT